jgi:hypothetical protein
LKVQPNSVEAKPIACSLSGADLSARTRWLGAIRQRALSVERRADGLTATFTPDAELETELHRLAQAESACCPFLRIAVRRADDALELDVSGPPEARPVIDEMFPSRA